MAIIASRLGDPTMIYRAICHDPLSAAVLSLREIKDMVNEMFACNKDYLPQFKHFTRGTDMPTEVSLSPIGAFSHRRNFHS